MMKTSTYITFYVQPAEKPLVTAHGDRSVSFHCPRYADGARGFCVQLRAEHIPQVEELLDALRTLKAPHNRPVSVVV